MNEVKDDKGALISKFSAYNAAGKIGKIEHGNGVTTTHLYDDLSLRLTAIETKDGAGTLIQNKEYTYSAAGDIESINDREKFVTHHYKYDHLHRLREETSTGVEKFQAMVLDFEYDDANLNAPLHAPKAVTQNGVAHAFTYDANGNMTDGWNLADPKSVVKRTISDYTPENMPGKVVYGADTISLTYDGAGKRAVKTTPAGATLYYFNHYEKKKDTGYNYVFAGNLRVAMVKQKAVSNERSVVYFHKDHLGSTNVTTDYLGKVQHASTYLPYGGTREESGVTDSGYMFTDQERDVEFGLYNYDARLYDPVMGLFVSADSVLPDLSNPESKHRFDPQTLDRFAYCRNNPIKYVDPDGNAFVIAPIIYIWAMKTVMTPDFENDLRFAADNFARGDYLGGILDLGCAGIPGASGGGRLSQPIRNFAGRVALFSSKWVRGAGNAIRVRGGKATRVGKKILGDVVKDEKKLAATLKTSGTDCAAHHLISYREAKNSPLMRRAVKLGYNFNGYSNGMALPTDALDSIAKQLPLHSGDHLKSYYRFVRHQLNKYDRLFEKNLLKDEDIIKTVHMIESRIEYYLRSGDLKLQYHGW